MNAEPVYAPPPVIEPGHTFSSVTEQIAGIVLTRRHPYSWFFGLFVGFMMTMMLLMAITWLLLKGTGIWGVNIPDRLGIRDHQLRLVDRYRPRRHADLGHSAAAEAGLADIDQPFR